MRELNVTKHELIQEAKGLNYSNKKKKSIPINNPGGYISSRTVKSLLDSQLQGFGTNKFTGGRMNLNKI